MFIGRTVHEAERIYVEQSSEFPQRTIFNWVTEHGARFSLSSRP
jgi:hypothetical protein